MKRLLFICTIGLVGSLAAIAACKQGEGDRCQVDDDCETGLSCNKATTTCTSKMGGAADASIIDQAPADAPVDGPPDAMLDAP